MIQLKSINTMNDQRLITLLGWVQSVAAEPLISVEPLNGDASFRRYFRLKLASKTAILMDAPLQHENPQAFVEISQWWQSFGIPAPQIIAFNLDVGALLLEDCGNRDLFSTLSIGAHQALVRSTAPNMSPDDIGLYRQALVLLKQIQQLTKNHGVGKTRALAIPDDPIGIYDEPKLRQELALFDQWFVPKFMPEVNPDLSQKQLAFVYDLLIDSALNQPRVLVHRDFHSRNLMVTAEGLKVLDFQDAVWGPVTYDWVSLLRDCYLCWSPGSEKALLNDLYHQETLLQTAFVHFDDFYKAYEWMGLQRHLKVLGTFTRLWCRDKKVVYLTALPRVLNYVTSVSENYPEFKCLASHLKDEQLSKRVQSIATVRPQSHLTIEPFNHRVV